MASHFSDSTGDARFATTDWGLIATAKAGDSPVARQALNNLCSAYWYPIYVYIRRRGYSALDAQDLTQGFFTSLLSHDFLLKIEREKGRFRSFLLVSCRNFLANELDRERARKRGDGRPPLPIEFLGAEGRYAREPFHEITADRLFERRWALTLLERVLAVLGTETAREGKDAIFQKLSPALLGGGSALPYAEVAKSLSMTEDAVKMAALRLRRRYRDLIVDEVARTVNRAEDVEDELRDLFAALAW